MCTTHKWASGITPKTPTGGHASVDTTQQSQRLTLRDNLSPAAIDHRTRRWFRLLEYYIK